MLFNAKTIPGEEQQLCYITQIEVKGVHSLPKGISPKVNVISRIEFELAYSDVTVQHVSHSTKEIK